MAILPSRSAPAAPPLLARAEPPAASKRPDNRQVVDAWRTIGQPVSSSTTAMPYPKAFTNARALLHQHGTSLRGPSDPQTSLGMYMPNLRLATATGREMTSYFAKPYVNRDDTAAIKRALETLKVAGFDIDAVASPRAQALAALDITFARWKKLPQTPLLSLKHLAVGVSPEQVNNVVASRKSEFAIALREADQAARELTKADSPGETASWNARRQAADARLKDADFALWALSAEMSRQVKDGAADWSRIKQQF